MIWMAVRERFIDESGEWLGPTAGVSRLRQLVSRDNPERVLGRSDEDHGPAVGTDRVQRRIYQCAGGQESRLVTHHIPGGPTDGGSNTNLHEGYSALTGSRRHGILHTLAGPFAVGEDGDEPRFERHDGRGSRQLLMRSIVASNILTSK